MELLHWLFQTDASIAALVLRITLAVVIFPHGAQKVLGWFGGHGFSGTMKYFAGSGIPAPLAVLAMAAEFLGPIGLAVGFLTRIAALGIACVMLVAMVKVHWQFGFFLNWFGNQKGEGIEYHLLALGVAIALMIAGGGAWSLDGFLAAQF
jgi:putative oxidoreductase